MCRGVFFGPPSRSSGVRVGAELERRHADGRARHRSRRSRHPARVRARARFLRPLVREREVGGGRPVAADRAPRAPIDVVLLGAAAVPLTLENLDGSLAVRPTRGDSGSGWLEPGVLRIRDLPRRFRRCLERWEEKATAVPSLGRRQTGRRSIHHPLGRPRRASEASLRPRARALDRRPDPAENMALAAASASPRGGSNLVAVAVVVVDRRAPELRRQGRRGGSAARRTLTTSSRRLSCRTRREPRPGDPCRRGARPRGVDGRRPQRAAPLAPGVPSGTGPTPRRAPSVRAASPRA